MSRLPSRELAALPGFQLVERNAPFFNATHDEMLLTVDLWLPAAVFSIWPLLGLASYIRHTRRLRVGCCRACGYDLRASLGDCPECGAAPRGVGAVGESG